MGYQSQHFIIIFVVFVIYLSYTLAPWHKQPIDPPANKTLTCEKWIILYGFSDNDLTHNVNEAQGRSREFDIDVSKWPALYAHLLCSFHLNDNFLPSDFCSKYASHRNMDFLKLSVATNSCVEWLKQYGFSDWTDGYTEIEPKILNWWRSKNRNKNEDDFISIWPSIFVSLLDGNPEEKSMTNSQFCVGMGQDEDTMFWSFMNLSTELNCLDWIHLAGYTNNYQENTKILRQTWAQRYFNHFNASSTLWMTPKEFCLNNEENPNNDKLLYTYDNKN